MSATLSTKHWTDEAPETEFDIDLAGADHYPDPVSLQPAITRWWWWFLLAAIVSAPIAFFVANEFASDSYVFDTSLVFNRSHFGAPLYEPPDIYVLAAMSSSPAMLHEMKHELHLKPGVDRIQELVAPEVRAGSNIISVELEWNDPKKARKILDWVNGRMVDRVRKLRDDRINSALADLNNKLGEYERLTESTHQGIVDFRNSHETYGVADQLRSIESEQAMLEKELSVTIAEMEALSEQLEGYKTQMMADDIAGEEIEEDALDKVDSEVAAAQDRLEKAKKDKVKQALDRIQQAKLQQRIREGKERVRLQTLRDAKSRELNEATSLARRGLIPRTDVTDLEDELRLIELDLEGTNELRSLENQLEDVQNRVDQNLVQSLQDGTVSPMGNVLSIGGPNNQPARSFSEMVEKWQLQFNARNRLVGQLQQQIEKKLEKKSALREVLPDSERLERKFGRTEQMRSRVEGQINDLEMLKRSDSNLLTILDEPSPGTIPMKSNMKKLMVGVYCISICVLCMPIVIRELFAPTPPSTSSRQRRSRPR